VSPSSFNADETITTCRFGVRAKKIKNKAKINAEKTVAEYKVEVAGLEEKIKGLQQLVKMLRADIKALRAGDLALDEEGQSAKVDRAYFQYLMNDGKDKKKKPPKKKGFFREGYKPPAEEKKKKKKKKKGKEEEDEEEETKDEEPMHEPISTETSFMDPEEEMVPAKHLHAAQEKIKELELEVIKAQAAAATASGLGDVNPMSPTAAHRQSVLPKPHRPAHGGHGTLSDLPGVGAMLIRQSSGRKSGASSPISDAMPPSTVLLKKQASLLLETDVDEDWKAVQGDIYSEQQVDPQVITKTVTETVMEMPTHLADLDPTLLELARRELQQENNHLRKIMEQMIHELDQEKIRTRKKAEALKLAKNQRDDAEMECDRLLLDKQVLEERIESFEQDRQRERKQIESFKDGNAIQKKETEQLKARLAAKEKEAAEEIQKIRQRERQRAEAFMKKAVREFKRVQAVQRRKEEQMELQAMVPQPANGRSAYEMMSIHEQQREAVRQKQVMNQQMHRLKEAMMEQLERIQNEQMKVKSALQTKNEECIRLQVSLRDMDEEMGKYKDVIMEKDAQIRRQTTELKAFGDLKLMSDKIHQKEFKTAQDTIFNLRKQLVKLERMNKDSEGDGSELANHQMQAIPIPIRGGGRKRKESVVRRSAMSSSRSPSPMGHHSSASSLMAKPGNVPTPIRGGGRNGHLSGPSHLSKTSDFFNNSGLRKGNAHALTPSYSFSPRSSRNSSKSGHRSISDASPLRLQKNLSVDSSHGRNLSHNRYGSGLGSGRSSGYTNVYSSGHHPGQSKRRGRGHSNADSRRQKSQNGYFLQ